MLEICMVALFFIFCLAFFSGLFLFGKWVEKSNQNRPVFNYQDIYKAFNSLGEDIRQRVFTSERKSVEFREQFLLYYKGMRDDLKAALDKIEAYEKSREPKHDA